MGKLNLLRSVAAASEASCREAALFWQNHNREADISTSLIGKIMRHYGSYPMVFYEAIMAANL